MLYYTDQHLFVTPGQDVKSARGYFCVRKTGRQEKRKEILPLNAIVMICI